MSEPVPRWTRLWHIPIAGRSTSASATPNASRGGIAASVGTVGDSSDNALAETINGLYKTELIKPRGPWRTLASVEIATAEWVDWSRYAGDIGVSDLASQGARTLGAGGLSCSFRAWCRKCDRRW